MEDIGLAIFWFFFIGSLLLCLLKKKVEKYVDDDKIKGAAKNLFWTWFNKK